MRTFKLGLTLLALVFGLAALAPHVAVAQENDCKAQCKKNGDDCAQMCKEHAPPNVQSRCVSTCKKVADKCKKDCDKNGSGQ